MNLFELLKQFKNVEPDPTFTATSKRAILATEPAAPVWSTRKMFFRIIETGVAVALTGFFVLLITGSLSGSRIAPAEYAAVDPTSLHAEAQAIDMQIQLAQLKYSESSAGGAISPVSSVPTASGVGITPVSTSSASSSSVSEPAATGTSTATSTNITLDQALEHLSN